jgi:DNA-binding MarR family transcriptional regulator
MTGTPETRSQLVEGLGTSVTTVNRVVAQLEKAGAIVTGRSDQMGDRLCSG